MNVVKRIFLYLLTNLLVVATISFVTNLLGLHGYLTEHGIDYQALASICLIWGMTSSVIALMLSRWMAKKVMKIKLINPATNIRKERQLIQVVYHLGRRLGLNTMPEVGIYDALEVNAFATGPTKNRSLVAVSSGLLANMNDDEVEGVLAHEMSHIANGDMVTMTLLQGIVNAFSLFLSRIFAYALAQALERGHRDKQRHSRVVYSILVVLFDICITLLGSMLIATFSRHREYRADRGGARLVGRQKMIAALERLQVIASLPEPDTDVVAPLKMHTKRRSRFASLLATHPEIDLRIKAVKNS